MAAEKEHHQKLLGLLQPPVRERRIGVAEGVDEQWNVLLQYLRRGLSGVLQRQNPHRLVERRPDHRLKLFGQNARVHA
jgi:hypothetical protein